MLMTETGYVFLVGRATQRVSLTSEFYYLSIYLCVCVYIMYIPTYLYVHTNTNTNTDTENCTRTLTIEHIHTHTNLYTRIYIYIYMCVCVCIKVKLTTLVEGDPKALFSIATTQKCSGGRYSINWFAPLYP